MKIKQHNFHFFAVIILANVFHLQAADLTNTTTFVQESWESISNRWSSFPLEKIKQAAETNGVGAQYFLAKAYFDGNGAEKNPSESFKWMQLAAQQGMARAQRGLGWMLENGSGCATNVDEAVGWYQKAAQQGDAEAQFNLGWMYDNGMNVSQDYGEAFKFYSLAADQGHSMAQNNLGWLYKKGWGIPDDQIAAVKWFKKSAEQGNKFAAGNLAWIYASGVYGPSNTFGQGAKAQILSGGVAPDHELAEKWMRQAVDLNSVEGQCQFGDLIYDEFDNEGHQDTSRFPDAALWYRKAAEQGYAKAQYRLADMYNTGELGDDQRSNCIPWYLKAAAQGNAEAQAVVGELPMYYPDSELLKSVNTLETLRQGAENGNLDAQFQLAKRYQFGIGVPKDAVEAFKWMQKAAQHDVATSSSLACAARYCLGVMYEKGDGVSQDIQKAYPLYIIAAFGSADAAFRVGQMYEKGEGISQDDHEAMAYYSGMGYYDDDPEQYPNCYIGYGVTTDRAIESLLNLWSQGRGFPNDKDKIEHGYREPNVLIKNWEGSIVTVKAEFYVGQIYYQGKLVPQDLVEATARFQVAANQNLDDARKILSELEPRMSSEQKKAAEIRYEILEKEFEQATDNAKRLVEANQQDKHYMPW